MNRRSFTKFLAAFGAAPALPALPMAATAAPIDPLTMGLARHYARARGAISTRALAARLGVNQATAARIAAQIGLSTAAIARTSLSSGARSGAARGLSSSRLTDMMDSLPDEAQPEGPEDTAS